MNEHPQTLLEAIRYFSDEVKCVEFLAALRWPDGKPVCPKCGSVKCVGLRTRKLFQCLESQCNKQFSVKAGSSFEKSPIPLTKWLPCMWLIANAKNGVSSCEIARSLGVTQKTAWFMLHRVRDAMDSGFFGKLSNEVEVDETWIGGKAANMSPARKLLAGILTAGHTESNKTIVFGMIERGGKIVAKVVENTRRATLIPEIERHVEIGAAIYSDALPTYEVLASKYQHSSVDHAKAFVAGKTHTNSLENFWSLLKRCIKGTYVQVAPFHVDAYVIEQAFRFNNRKTTDAVRFSRVAKEIFGKRLTYAELTGKI